MPLMMLPSSFDILMLSIILLYKLQTDISSAAPPAEHGQARSRFDSLERPVLHSY
jgi:hypothetical protein